MATGILLLGLPSCGDKQQEARSELTAKSFTFTVDEYIRAARAGDVPALKHFLEAGMVVDVTNADGCTALFCAAQSGRAEAVDFLAGKGAATEVTGTNYDTPLVAAARAGSVETVKALLKAKADPAVRTRRNWTALTAAAYGNDVEIVKLLAPLSSESLDEALQIASLKGTPAVVDTLLSSGADVFSRSKDNKTPLMYAAANGHTDVVRLLMLSGSNKLLFDNDHQTAADLAVKNKHPGVVDVLNDPSLVNIRPDREMVATAEAAGGEDSAAADPGAPADAAIPGDVPTHPDTTVATVASVEGGTSSPAGPEAVDPGLTAAVAEGAPFDGLEAADTAEAARGGGAVAADSGRPSAGPDDGSLAQAVATQVGPPPRTRLQGARLSGMTDGSTTALTQSVRVRDFREGQLPIVLEEVPATGESARIRVLGRGGNAPEIVPAGGVIGDTGLELVRVERRFIDSKMAEGRLLDVSQAVVRDRVTGQRHVVRKDQTVSSSRATAFISAGPGAEVYEAQEGDEFTVGDEQPARYKVLDVRPTQVVVENLDSGETATLARSYAR